jgi:hypothetical protein
VTSIKSWGGIFIKQPRQTPFFAFDTAMPFRFSLNTIYVDLSCSLTTDKRLSLSVFSLAMTLSADWVSFSILFFSTSISFSLILGVAREEYNIPDVFPLNHRTSMSSSVLYLSLWPLRFLQSA